MVYPNRFKSDVDECVHIIIGLLISDVYDSQKQDIVDFYGSDIVEEAREQVTVLYGSLLARF